MSETTFTTQNATDGQTLFGRSHVPEAPKAVLSLVHGLGEHSGRYHEMASWLNQQGIAVNLIDLHGHGKTPGGRGVCKSMDLMLDDIDALLDYSREGLPGLPHFLMGHSMGGLLVLTYGLQRPPADLAGFISQAPALEPVELPPGIQLSIMRLLRPLLPKLAASNGIDPSTVSKDEAAVKAYINDPLVHDKICIALGLDLIDTGAWVRENAALWQEPLLLMHGDQDLLTSCAASAAFVRDIGDHCTFEMVADGFHEIHNDPEREQVYARIASWIGDRLT
ncbi:alpha/beta hydrolase [Parvularcula sp. IMCC14364]|uniref:alpha/beta hydrolase n=1 Tax=Parvularcula sp. IMCC14364 TaxID=3067902 RepID=UPI0027412E7C|nr:alpha/beta hydrolase [Parvularcula sp. IMCC14364]